MPQADFTSEYRSDAGQSKFPRLKLQEGEKARIVVVSKPVTEYVHRLEAPNIVNMAPVYRKIKDREGQEQYVVDTRFVSGPICHGTYEILRERGVDDKNCQACLMSRDRPDIFRPPFPKYAVNVLRYGLRPGGSWNDIAQPYGVSALIWVFGAKVMDKLADIRTMGPAYEDIRTVDLLLYCEDKTFQKPYSNGEFMPYTPAVWLANDQTRNYTAQYLASNGASNDDLIAAIGKRVKVDWLADDINRVIHRWDVVRAYEARSHGGPGMGPQGFGAETLQQGLGQLHQQYSQPPGFGQVPPGPQGYAQQQQGAGMDMSLLGVPGQEPNYGSTGFGQPSHLGGPTPYSPLAAQQQNQQPGQLGDMFVPSTQTAGAGSAVTAPVAGMANSASSAGDLLGLAPATTSSGSQVPPTSVPDVAQQPPGASAPTGTVSAPVLPDVSSPSSLPQGLAGLNEFMASQTSNPSMAAQPSVSQDSLKPPPAQPSGEKKPFTFEELAKMAAS